MKLVDYGRLYLVLARYKVESGLQGWLHMKVESAPLRLQLGELNDCVHCQFQLLSTHRKFLYGAFGMNFHWIINIYNQDDQRFHTFNCWADGERSQCVKMVHDMFLWWMFGSNTILLMFLCYASCRMYAFVFFGHINKWSKALSCIFLNNLCSFFMWNVCCWNFIYDLCDTNHCLNAFVCMVLSILSKEPLCESLGLSYLFNGCKRLLLQYYNSEHYEDSLLEC